MSRRPLPWFTGPKLAPFAFQDEANPAITFTRHLGYGLHSEVFEATIENRAYAIKLFRFVDPLNLAYTRLLREGLISAEDLLHLKHPFYCECRAYGRLKEANREDIVVKSLGYVLLTREQEEQALSIAAAEWNRRPVDKDKPIRGIVKELVPKGTPPFTFDMLPQMRRNILALNKLGVVAGDLRADNYLGGRIADLSQACTSPHLELDWDSWSLISRETIMQCCISDQVGFDMIVAEWNQDHPDQIFWLFFFPNSDYCRKLRSASRPGRKHMSFYKMEGARFDAASYDWRKHAKQLAPTKRQAPDTPSLRDVRPDPDTKRRRMRWERRQNIKRREQKEKDRIEAGGTSNNVYI